MQDKPFLCPFCKRKLEQGEKRRYETTCEHVDDPNADSYPLRDTYVCSCDESKNSYWSIDGESYSLVFNPKNWGKKTEAINSFAWECRIKYGW